MHDPRSQLSSQDLIYAATALRVEAHLTEQRAQEPRYGSTCRVFKEAAAHKRELAERVQRIAEMVRAMERPAARSVARNDEGHRS